MLKNNLKIAVSNLQKQKGYAILNIEGPAAIGVAFLTVSFQAIKAALADPVKSLPSE